MPIIGPSQQTYTQEIPPEWIAVEQAAKLLEEMCLGIGGPIGLNEIEEPCRGSTYAEDSEFGGDIAKHLHARACDLLLVAIDHGRALARCIEHPPIALAGFTCGRAVLETCSSATWLTDSRDGVDPSVRIGRYFDFVLDGYIRNRRRIESPENQVVLDISLQDADRMYKKAIDDVMRHAERLEMQPKKWLGSPRHPVFSGIPSPSNLADQYFNSGALIYQFYSAISHGSPWATDNQRLVKANPNTQFRILYQSRRALSLIMNVMAWLSRTYEQCIHYCGLDILQVSHNVDHYSSQLEPLIRQVDLATSVE